MSTPQSTTTEASVSHLIIFNPDLKPAPGRSIIDENHYDQQAKGQGEERDKDLEDDMKEASQILFYTSRSGGKVSRDTMLRQFGLAKGLMGFTDMVIEGESGKSGWWSVHSQKSRMIIYSPEDGFHIYLNVSLGSQSTGETSHTSQGLLDQMIVDGLKRGYEDFRLLHGPLTGLIPSTTGTSSVLDRFWTKFAFQFESTHLSPTDPGSLLTTWVGGYPISQSVAPPINLDILPLEGIKSGLIGREGPLPSSDGMVMDISLVRFLVNRLHASLPPPPAPILPVAPSHSERSTLGLGFGLGGRRKKPTGDASRGVKDESRSSSSNWSSWVPSIGLGLPKGSSETDQTLAPPGTESQSRWPSFGLSGVGTVFGLGKPASDINRNENKGKESPARPVQEQEQEQEQRQAEVEDGSTSMETESLEGAHGVEQTNVAVEDLQEAVQVEDEIELSWEKKDIWLPVTPKGEKEEYEKRRVAWIIRDETLLFILYPPGLMPPYPVPSTTSTLKVFASLAPPPRHSVDSTRPSTPTTPSPMNAYMYSSKENIVSHETIDQGSLQTLTELKDRLNSDTAIQEVYAKTSTGNFVIAKKSNGVGELYLQVGRKDASLTDAEHAVRSVGRTHPELGI